MKPERKIPRELLLPLLAVLQYSNNEISNVKTETQNRIIIPANKLPTNQLWPAHDLCLAYTIFKTKNLS